MRVFRLTRKKYGIALSGVGAAQSNNRWNSKGTEIVYTAESRALAMAEVLVHLSLQNLPNDFVMLEIEIPDAFKVDKLDPKQLPMGWNNFPHLRETEQIGDQFIKMHQSCILKVPSSVVPGDWNYLFNPNHSDSSQVKIISQHDFPFDNRLFK